MNTHLLFSATLLVFAACIFPAVCQSTNNPENIVGQFRNSRMISILFETDHEAVSRIVPAQFQTAASNLFDLNIATQIRSDGPMFYELFIQIPVQVNGREGSYIPISFVDSNEASNRINSKGLVSKPAEFLLLHGMNRLYYRVFINGTDIAVADYTIHDTYATGAPFELESFVNLSETGEFDNLQVTDFVITKAFDMGGSFF